VMVAPGAEVHLHGCTALPAPASAGWECEAGQALGGIALPQGRNPVAAIGARGPTQRLTPGEFRSVRAIAWGLSEHRIIALRLAGRRPGLRVGVGIRRLAAFRPGLRSWFCLEEKAGCSPRPQGAGTPAREGRCHSVIFPSATAAVPALRA